MKENFWRDKIYNDLKEKDVKNILAFYSLSGNFCMKPVYGGWRKACFLVDFYPGRKYVLAVYPPESLSQKQIQQAVLFEQMALKKGLPCRKILTTKTGSLLLSHDSSAGKIYAVLFSFLPGETVHPFGKKQIRQAAFGLAKLHRSFLKENGRTLLHNDFARGNLLFDNAGRLCGIIDFEEAKWGRPKSDTKKTLSFLYKDCLDLTKKEIDNLFWPVYDRYCR